MGKLVERLNFGRIKERGTMPHFLEFQLDSYEDFLQAKEAPNNRKDKGLESAFREIFPVESSNGDIKLEYVSYELHEAEPPLNDELECKKRGKTYSTSLKVRLRLINKKSGNEIQESLVYFGEVPMMTERGTFIINGAERVVVSQLHRSPGVSFNKEINIQTGKDLFSGKIIHLYRQVKRSGSLRITRVHSYTQQIFRHNLCIIKGKIFPVTVHYLGILHVRYIFIGGAACQQGGCHNKQ